MINSNLLKKGNKHVFGRNIATEIKRNNNVVKELKTLTLVHAHQLQFNKTHSNSQLLLLKL